MYWEKMYTSKVYLSQVQPLILNSRKYRVERDMLNSITKKKSEEAKM